MAESQTPQAQMVRVEAIAQLFSLSVEQVYRLTKEGIIKSEKIPNSSARQYPFIETIQAYIGHLKDKAASRNKTTEALKGADLAKRELETRALETKLALAEGRAHDASDVRRVWNDIMGAFKMRLWAMPQILAPMLVGETDEDVIQDILHDEISTLCGLLTSYNAESFYSRNQDYLREEAAMDEDYAEANE